MIVKLVGSVTKVVSVTFTALIAPLIVNFAISHMNVGDHLAPETLPTNSATPIPVPTEQRDVVVCQGLGRTASEARRNALQNAVLRVTTTLNRTASESGMTRAPGAILNQPEVFVTRCEELGSVKQLQEGYQKEYLVEVATERLAVRLRDLNTRTSVNGKN